MPGARDAGLRVPGRVVLVATGPALVLLLAVFAFPILQTVRLSFSEWSGVGPATWVGLDNYRDLLSGDELFHSAWVTVVFSVVATTGIVLFALLMAVAASRRMRGDELVRAIWFLPAIAPATAAAAFWSISVQPHTGVVNELLGLVGLGNDHTWLASPDTALYVIVGVAVWTSSAFPFLLLVGAIDRVPDEVYEAARIDGAGEWRQLRHFTLPLIRPVLAMVIALELIWNFNAFTLVWSMTKGGPASSTAILPVMLYQEGFKNGHLGVAAAIGVLSSVVLLAVGFLTLRSVSSRTDG